jgi:cyanate permease
LRSIGSIFGVSGLFATLGAFAGPILTGYLFDITGSYQTSFLVCASITGVGFFISLALSRSRLK